MAPGLDVELLISVAGGLGRLVEDESGKQVYEKDDDCLENLKDLQRFLRRDDPETRDAFKMLGELDVVHLDLAPIIVTYQDDFDLVYNALKVATFLTMPLDQMSEDKQIQIKYMQQSKSSFMVGDSLSVIVTLLAEPLSRHPRMSDQDSMIVQLILTFFRNLLCVPEYKGSAASGGDHLTYLREELLLKFFDDSVMELLLLVLQHVEVPPFDTEGGLLLEIVFEIFRGHTPEALLSLAAAPAPLTADERRKARRERVAALEAAGEDRAEAERKAREAESASSVLGQLLAKEQSARQSAPAPSRHSRFGGSYSRHHVVGGGKTVVTGNPASHDFDKIKAHKASAKNKVLTEESAPRCSHRLAVKLVEYAEQVMESGAYTVLMFKLRDELKRREDGGWGLSRLDEDDMVRFLHTVKFFTSFQKHKVHAAARKEKKAEEAAAKQKAEAAAKVAGGDKENKANAEEGAGGDGAAAAEGGEEGAKAKAEGEGEDESPFAAITATLDLDCFNLVLRKWREQVDQPNNSEEKDWELQGASLATLKEMLAVLALAQKTGNKRDRSSADRLQRSLLHDSDKDTGILQLLARLVKGFNRKRQPRSHAVDMVEAIHVVLKMLERLDGNDAGGFQIKARRKKRKAKKKAARDAEKAKAAAEALEKKKEEEEAEEGDGGGGGDKAAGEGEEGAAKAAAAEEGEGGAKEKTAAEGEEGGEDGGKGAESEEDESEESEVEEVHKSMDFDGTFQRELVSPLTIHIYVWLLQGWASNGNTLNHAIASFIARVCSPMSTGHMSSKAADDSLAPCMYQVSILRVVCVVLNDRLLYKDRRFDELRHVLTKLTQGLFAKLLPTPPPEEVDSEAEEDDGEGAIPEEEATRRAEKKAARAAAAEKFRADEAVGSMLFVECCFWKNRRTAMEIRDRYNCTEREVGKEGALKGMDVGGTMHLGGDLGGDEGAEFSGMAMKRKERKKRPGLFSEAQEAVLGALYEQFSARRAYVTLIAQEMTERGHTFTKGQVSRQLKKMGLGKSRPPAGADGGSRKGRAGLMDALGSSDDDEEEEVDGADSPSEDDEGEAGDSSGGEEAGAEAAVPAEGGEAEKEGIAVEEEEEEEEEAAAAVEPSASAAAGALKRLRRTAGAAETSGAIVWAMERLQGAEAALVAAESAGEDPADVAVTGPEPSEEDAEVLELKGVRAMLRALGLRKDPDGAWVVPAAAGGAGAAKAAKALAAAVEAHEAVTEASPPPRAARRNHAYAAPPPAASSAPGAEPAAKGRAVYKNKRKAARRRIREVMGKEDGDEDEGEDEAEDGSGDEGEGEEERPSPPKKTKPSSADVEAAGVEEEEEEEEEEGGGGGGLPSTIPGMMAKRRRLLGGLRHAAAPPAAVAVGAGAGLELDDDLADDLGDDDVGDEGAGNSYAKRRANVLDDSDEE